MHELSIPTKTGEIVTRKIWSVSEIIERGAFRAYPDFAYKKRKKYGGKKAVYYMNIPLAFDIETSRINESGENYTFMYHWQMTINGIIIFGRRWDEWLQLLQYIHDVFKCDEKHKVIIYVQNLGYEFQFFYSRLEIDKIFARVHREPISVDLAGSLYGIIFKCSYALSGYSLEEIAKHCTGCPYFKDKEELDYSIVRTEKTTLSPTQEMYCAKDVLIIHYYIKELIENEHDKNIGSIPLTKTGFIRRKCRLKVKSDKEWKIYYNKQKLTAEEFILYNRAYRGGDTHANAIYCNNIVPEVYSFDLTSSYPYRLIAEDFPLSAPNLIRNPSGAEFTHIIKNDWLFIVELQLSDVKLKSISHFDYIAIAKCNRVSDSHKCENGRVLSADYIAITVTSVDFKVIADNYNFNIIGIPRLIFHRKKGLLPKVFRDFVLELYGMKTKLKGVPGAEKDYMRSKEDVNSLYGMCVTNPLNDEITFNDGEWVTNEMRITESNIDRIEEELRKAYRSRSNFLPYSIGVWVSAYARQDLHRGLDCCSDDAVYWDTDSCKFINRKHYNDFDRLNNEKLNRLLSLNYTENEIAPKDIKGKSHCIGLWDEEYPDGVDFLTFGAKKYFYVDRSDMSEHITVAGLNKKTGQNFLTNECGGVLHAELGMIFDNDAAGKTKSEYCNIPFSISVDGVICSENSYINITPTTYTLSDALEHNLYVALVQKKVKNR